MTQPASSRLRALWVSHTRTALPQPPHEAHKWEVIGERLEVQVLVADGGGPAGRPFLRLRTAWAGPLSGAVFYAAVPFVVRRIERTFAPHVIFCQSPFEAAVVRLARPRAAVVCEVHGDWGTAATAYGSPLRRLIARPVGVVARRTVRAADGVRTVSPATTELVRRTTGRTPTRTFPAWIAADAFEGPPEPLPARPTALWVGALQPAKDPETLAAAWPAVLEAVPEAQLVMVGDGPLHPVVDALVARFPDSVRRHPRLEADALRVAYDGAWLLVLPSRSEGYGRVAAEALMRGRPVVGSRVGGIPELVGAAGVLGEPGSPDGLAASLIGVLGDRDRATALAALAQARGVELDLSADGYADQVAELAAAVSGG